MKPIASACLLVVCAAPLPAQAHPAGGPLAVVEGLFEAMRRADTTAMRAVFDPSTRLVSTTTRNGVPVMRVVAIEQWLQAVAGAPAQLDERIWDPVVQIDDHLATVWVRYELLVDGELSHCGVDAFQLFKSAAGWKIFQVADTQRREGCEKQS